MEFGGIINHDDFYQLEEEGKEDSIQDDNENQQHVTASAIRGHYVPYVQVILVDMGEWLSSSGRVSRQRGCLFEPRNSPIHTFT